MPEQAQPLETWAIVEEWRAVPRFEGLYEVSDAGRVRRIGRAARNGNGRGGGARVGHILKLSENASGYVVAQLWRDGKPCSRLVHRLVAAAFVGPRPADHDVNHRDGTKTNNRPANLEYLTRSENNQHAYDTGLHPKGERHVGAKLTAADVAEIRRANAAGEAGCRVLARRYGRSKSSIQLILNNHNWRQEGSHV